MISFNHVRMVYNTFEVDDHKLKSEDIERIDRHNWHSVQQIALRHGQSYLKEMRRTSDGRVERTLGTKTYPMIVAN